jgi:hypothetical protein
MSNTDCGNCRYGTAFFYGNRLVHTASGYDAGTVMTVIFATVIGGDEPDGSLYCALDCAARLCAAWMRAVGERLRCTPELCDRPAGFSLGQAAPNFPAFSLGRSAGTRIYRLIDRVPAIDARAGGKRPATPLQVRM